jgi:hypothetical protein
MLHYLADEWVKLRQQSKHITKYAQNINDRYIRNEKQGSMAYFAYGFVNAKRRLIHTDICINLEHPDYTHTGI